MQILRRVWVQQFYAALHDQPVRWRTADDLPPAPLLISSPYDPDARYGQKRDTEWTGYKVHLTETCDDDTPNLITDVTTTRATTTDFAVLPHAQAQLAVRDLTPREQIVDAGYLCADYLATSRAEHGIDPVGPAAPDRSWQARTEDGLTAAPFVLDWEAQHATCRAPSGNKGTRVCPCSRGRIGMGMSRSTSGLRKRRVAACPVRARCVHSPTAPRGLQVQDRDQYEARQRQQTELSQRSTPAVLNGRHNSLRHAHGRRTPVALHRAGKTRLMHLLPAAAINFMRVAAWLAETPRSRTRQSTFAALAGAAS